MFVQRKRMFSYVTSALAILFFAITAHAIAEDEREVYSGFLINKSRDALNNSATVRVTIDRWSTEDERAELFKALADGGHEAFVKAIHGQKETGFVHSQTASDTVGGLPRIVTRYARKTTENGKTIIVLVTDRPMRGKEDPEFKKYNISALRLELPGGEKGTGIVYVALKVGYDKEKQRLLLTKRDARARAFDQYALEQVATRVGLLSVLLTSSKLI